MTDKHRRKQPDMVRAKLLQTAEALTALNGWGNFSLNDVAARADISKGGLLHHFPSKNALLDALYGVLLERLDSQMETLMQADPHPPGRFIRAYLTTAHQVREGAEDNALALLSLALVCDHELRRKWQDWVHTKMTVIDNDAFNVIVRLAADGLWLAGISGDPIRELPALQTALDHLASMTKLF